MYNFPKIPAECQIDGLGEIYEQYLGYKTDGFFVEVGAFDGYSWSNTLPLIDAGWSGIMVEPDPDSFALLCNRHGQNNKLTLVNYAINWVVDSVKLYPNGSTSTIMEPMLGVFLDDHTIPGWVKEPKSIYVNAVMMDDMLYQCHCPKKFDVLSIDVEGAESNVLSGYNIDKHRPVLAIIEMSEAHTSWFLRMNAKWITDYFSRNGYQRFYYDGMNAIYHDLHYVLKEL